MKAILTGQSMKISTEIFQKIDFKQSDYYLLMYCFEHNLPSCKENT